MATDPKEDRPFPFERAAQSIQVTATRSISAASVSYTLTGAILLLGGLGYAFDSWRGTAPWGLLTGLLLGVVVGFYELTKTMWRR